MATKTQVVLGGLKVFRAASAMLFVLSLPAAAVDACFALDPIEIVAALRGPGVVVRFQGKTVSDHISTCFFARLPELGSYAENLRRFQSDAPPTLTVTVADNVGSKGFDVLRPQPDSTNSEVSGIGDRAVLRRAATGERLGVASGSTFFLLGFEHDVARGSHQKDLIALAKEALATNVDAQKVVKHEIAEGVVANDKAAFESDPKDFAVFLMALKNFDDARAYDLRAAEAHPDDPDILFLQGVLDWKMTYPLHMETRVRLGLPAQPLAGSACVEVRAANLAKVEDGIAALSKAIRLRPDFDDAMKYLSLMYRERSDYQCDNGTARGVDLRSADDWAGKSNATKANFGLGTGNVLAEFFFPFPIPPPPPPPPQSTNAGHGSPMSGVVGDVTNATPARIPVFAPEAVPGFAMSQRVRLPVGASQQLWLSGLRPSYPPLARQARIQGTVVLKAVIGKDGLVETLTVGSGHPMLVPAALDAVKHWKYKPYLLNGKAVEVDTEIWVDFSLSAS
jgi:TonB family protein